MGRRPYVRGSKTSQAAAEAVFRPGPARERIFQFIASCGRAGATDDEIQIALNLKSQTESARRVELFESGRIVKYANETRSTRQGRQGEIYLLLSMAPPGAVLTAFTERTTCANCGQGIRHLTTWTLQ